MSVDDKAAREAQEAAERASKAGTVAPETPGSGAPPSTTTTHGTERVVKGSRPSDMAEGERGSKR